MSENQVFAYELKLFGLREAIRLQDVRKVWNTVRKTEDSPCRSCKTLTLCHLCGWGGNN